MKLFTIAAPLLLAGSANAGVFLKAKHRNVIPDEYIVVLKNEVSLKSADGVDPLDKLSTRFFAKQTFRSIPGFRGFHARLNEEELAAMLADDSVAFVEPDQLVYAIGSLRGEEKNQTTTATCSDANDVQTGDQSWGQSRTTRLSGTGDFAHEQSWGKGVKVYVIDTGSNCEHEDFNAACSCGPSYISGAENGCADGNGHGTHCASTAAGTIWGIAKSAEVVGVKVLSDSGSGSTSGVISGMNWVASQGSGSVASMSLGGGYSAASNAAVQAMTDAGVTVVVAAGNDYGADACGSSPASAESAYTVGSTDISDARSSFSNIGSCVDIFAPGSSITAAWYTPGTTNTISGTSMATPHVAGAAAAILSQHPSYTPAEVKAALDELALSNALSDVGTSSPNKLLHLDC